MAWKSSRRSTRGRSGGRPVRSTRSRGRGRSAARTGRSAQTVRIELVTNPQPAMVNPIVQTAMDGLRRARH